MMSHVRNGHRPTSILEQSVAQIHLIGVHVRDGVSVDEFVIAQSHHPIAPAKSCRLYPAGSRVGEPRANNGDLPIGTAGPSFAGSIPSSIGANSERQAAPYRPECASRP